MYRLTLPIYYTVEKIRKKDHTFLISMNWYRNANHHLQNKVKKHYHNLVRSLLSDFTGDEIGKYRVKYKLYYKNKSCDMMNVVSMIDKFLNDVIQEMGIVENDNVKFYTKCMIEVVEQDKENPRVEIEIEELE